MTNRIGLDTVKSKLLADKMNELLADYMIFYQNTRGLHGLDVLFLFKSMNLTHFKQYVKEKKSYIVHCHESGWLYRG